MSENHQVESTQVLPTAIVGVRPACITTDRRADGFSSGLSLSGDDPSVRRHIVVTAICTRTIAGAGGWICRQVWKKVVSLR